MRLRPGIQELFIAKNGVTVVSILSRGGSCCSWIIYAVVMWGNFALVEIKKKTFSPIHLTLYRSSSEFPKLLSLSMETFLTFCDDADSNVRIAADECLNRCIMVSLRQQINMRHIVH